MSPIGRLYRDEEIEEIMFSLHFAFAASARGYATPYVLKNEKPQDWKHRSDVDKLLANVSDGSHHQAATMSAPASKQLLTRPS
ncbi:hypothetical protein DAPPUDRAFT_276218 [Daphnia pulex]|uniref:Uncharacterized protein n=1 Tax=Daphnia pulex TaxID=6669 RepID=E9I5R0_DAPPU|nr:hypothetical protein DAPPUDRAFT_276218 [Daphnia pulex]|eukprot:EFX60670.1 hypothetical protein DAPPUDRAFT_276218 [Daphnia pulex]